MKRPPHAGWPPLIVASNKPPWLWWRDLALTIFMWLIFAIMLETEFELFFGRYLERLGWGDFDTNPNWERFFERLRPFVVLIFVEMVGLGFAAVATIHRFRVAFQRPPRPPLQPAEEAVRAGMSEDALTGARGLNNAVVYVMADGSHRVEPRKT
jgi:hypothetical protein